MKIDKNKPLPDHTVLNYEECCAKLILEEIYPDCYSNLILADKPDIHGKNVGIEVTIANDRKRTEVMNNWVKAHYSSDGNQQRYYLERITRKGINCSADTIELPCIIPNFNLIRNAIENKIAKLKKGNYKFFKRYELFIFTETWFHSAILEEAKAFLLNSNVSDYYKTIFILSMDTFLYRFETDSGNFSCIKIDLVKQSNRNNYARRMVEENEK